MSNLWHTILSHAESVGTIGALLAIISFVFGAFGWLARPGVKWIILNVWNPILEARARIPRHALVVQPGDRRATFWADGRAGDKPLTQVRIWLHLSNVTTQLVQVSKAWLHFRRHCVLPQMHEGTIDVRLPDIDRFGDYAILPGRMSDGIAVWMISPAIHKAQKPLRVRVQIVDQFGFSHWTETIKVGFVGDARRLF
jgi:hypothetical protein